MKHSQRWGWTAVSESVGLHCKERLPQPHRSGSGRGMSPEICFIRFPFLLRQLRGGGGEEKGRLGGLHGCTDAPQIPLLPTCRLAVGEHKRHKPCSLYLSALSVWPVFFFPPCFRNNY